MDDEETALMDTPSHLKPAPKPGDKVQLGTIEVEVMRYVGTGEWVILRALEEHVGEDKVRVGEETGAVAKLRNAVIPEVSSRQTGVSGFYKHVCRCFEKTGVSGFCKTCVSDFLKRVCRVFENRCVGVLKTGVSVFRKRVCRSFEIGCVGVLKKGCVVLLKTGVSVFRKGVCRVSKKGDE